MEGPAPIIFWFRRDFRLTDHPGMAEAAGTGRPIIPVFVLDEVAETYGAAPKWRLNEALRSFAGRLTGVGARLVLRRGNARDTLLSLARETGARDIWWSRAYDPDAIARDTGVKAALIAASLRARSFPGHVLFEPWTVSTRQGGFFRVYSPMWRAVRDMPVPPPVPAIHRLTAPETWPESEAPETWCLGAAMHRGAAVIAKHACVGEAAAAARLAGFFDGPVEGYTEHRDFPAMPATSRLSEHLAWGEIGPRTVWHSGMQARQQGAGGAEHFLKELVWREFAYHLAYHSPHITRQNWRPEWDRFPWSEEEDEAVLRWQQGRTGVPLVDAAMRELYVSGYMHNRSRMIAGSYLTKHMLKHWRIGQRWFEDCLIDWDPASNAMGWQWVAGSGPDAAPYFRIFNPGIQAKKFDPDTAYIRQFVAELSARPGAAALAFFDACPRSWGLSADDGYPDPVVELARGRERALAAYKAFGQAL